MIPHSVVMMLIHLEGRNFLSTRLDGSSDVWTGGPSLANEGYG